MADPVSIAQHIYNIAITVKDMVDTFHQNEKGCPMVCDLLDTVSVNMEELMPNIKENSGMRKAMVRLEMAMERSLERVTEYQKKSTPHRAFNTKGAAKMLDEVHKDILANLSVSLFASSAHHSSELASIKELVAELHARQEEILQQNNHNSTDAASDQSKNRRERKKENIARYKEVKENQAPAERVVPSAILPSPEYILSQLEVANVIGEGGSGTVHKVILNEEVFAIKKFHTFDLFTVKRFYDEYNLILALKHPNIMKLQGFCHEVKKNDVGVYKEHLLFVSIYMPNKSLRGIINGDIHIDLNLLFAIIQGLANGICYLHKKGIAHLDLKPSTVLLDSNMVPKINDFGTAMTFAYVNERNLDDVKNLPGTLGYIAPEQKEKAIVSTKSDVFSFGAVTLETIISTCTKFRKDWHIFVPREWYDRLLQNEWSEIFDPTMVTNDYEQTVATICLIVGLRCCASDPASRPSMAKVVDMLAEGQEKDTQKEVSSHTSNSTGNASCREKKIRKTSRAEVKVANNVLVDNKAPCGILSNVSAKSASVESMVEQHDSICDKASNCVSKLVDEVQPVAASAESSCLLRIIGVSKVPGDAGSYKIRSRVCKTSKLVVYPPEELCFHFEPNKKASQPVTLTNTTNEYVGVWITPTDGQFTCPRTAKMVPNSTLSLSVTMEMHEQPPQDTAKFEVLMILVKSKDDLVKLQSSIGEELKMDSCFRALVKELQGKVYQAMLRVITCDEPESCQIISRSTKNLSWVTSTDVHPINPWIVTSHEGGEVRIWDYEKKKTVMSFFPVTDNKMASKDAYFVPEMDQYSKSKADPRWVYSAKFIARKNWLVVGDGNGLIHIYNYYLGTGDDKLCLRKVNKKPLRVYGRGKSVDSLAVHPTMTYLLLSSACDGMIKLWDWSSDEIKEFDANTNGGVCHLMFNPRDDTCSFACVTDDGSAKVWNMEPSSTTPTTTLEGLFNADYFFAESYQHVMVTLGMTGKYISIRDLQAEEVVHTLGVSERKMICVACHPTLPILATTLDDGTVCLWDAVNCRLEKMIHITDSNPRDLTFVTDTNGKTRLIITSDTRISILEVNLPMASTSQQSGGPKTSVATCPEGDGGNPA